MAPSRISLLVKAAVLATLASAAHAQPVQQAVARIGYVFPAGGRQGEQFDVTIGGKYLEGITEVHVSGGGVKAFVIAYYKPTRGAAATAISETVTLRFSIAADAQTGPREVRLESPGGLTNPLAFHVGSLPEVIEKSSRSSGGQADMAVTLPVVINGQILPGEVDRFRFSARKGQRLVFAACARELVPYIPDAVPGWFQAVLAVYDAKGNELAYAGDFRFHPDPVAYCEIPKEGDYFLDIRDSIYRGREDFVYRISAGDLPFITGIFPLGGKAGAQSTVELKGWNLPATRLTPTFAAPGIYPLSVRKRVVTLTDDLTSTTDLLASTYLVSNQVPFAADTLPECLEKEPNDTPQNAQPVTLPVIVNGRVNRPGDRNVFRFEARSGDEVVAEVYARRLDSPLDSVLKLTDAAGKQLAYNDDYEDKGAGLLTHHADSLLRAALPADGTYYLHLGDAQHKGGPEYAYRLRAGPPQPGFELRVVPSSINVGGGAIAPISVYALRKDGFSGDIDLALKDAPPGFALGGARVPAGAKQVRLTLTAPAAPPKQPITLAVEGRAIIGGREVVRAAVPAEDMMQAFAYRHLVPARELKVTVLGRAASKAALTVRSPTPVKIPAGGTARVQMGVPAGTFSGDYHIALDEPPDGIAVEKSSPSGEIAEIVLPSDAEKVKPGLKGNLIVYAFAGKAQRTAKDSAQANRRRTPLGLFPAVPFEIVARE